MHNQQNSFREEAYELLTELETALLELEENPGDNDLVDRVFRAMHTIKGSGAMFGFDDIAAFTHELETVFDLVREGQMVVTGELVNLSLSAVDQIKAMLDASTGFDAAGDQKCRTIITALRQIVPPDHNTDPTDVDEHPTQRTVTLPQKSGSSDQHQVATYRICFKPNGDLFKNGTNPLLLLDELRQMGSCTVIAHTNAIPPLEKIDVELCYIFWDIVLTTDQDMNAIADVFIFVEDESDIQIQKIDNNEADHKRIGEILMERGDLHRADLEKALSEQPRIGEMLLAKEMVHAGSIQAALAEQKHVKQVQQQKQQTINASSIRVAAEKLDRLVDLVGELVTVQARLSQKSAEGKDADLLNISETVERLTAELRDSAMSIRMLPIGSTFSKFKRMVRDLSNELGKDVVLTTEGGETELDKTVIEQLNDPLVHIIRNSIDHGIEPPAGREAAGKPRQAMVRLSAGHCGANVLMQITDDGAGLDCETIRKSAVAKGLIPTDVEMSNKEIFNLIFEPGFSTAESVSNISGRGVGMDVVKRGIESLRGSIDIDSTPGHGTVITLKLPLTLAIIDGLLVEIEKERYVLPLSVIEECVELTREDVRRTHGRNMLNIRGDIVPFVSLRQRFHMPGTAPDIEQVVINEVNGQRIGVVVDRVIGEHQIVIKTMSKIYREVDEISGATILGDGTVALILDIAKLMENAEDKTKMAA